MDIDDVPVSPEPAEDPAQPFEALLENPTNRTIAAAALALYRHKRARDPDVALLEDAYEYGKRMCRQRSPLRSVNRYDRPQAGARRIAWTSDEEDDE